MEKPDVISYDATKISQGSLGGTAYSFFKNIKEFEILISELTCDSTPQD